MSTNPPTHPPMHADDPAVELLDVTTHYTCQDCGHEWDADPLDCVACGAPAELVIVYPARYVGEGDAKAPVCVDCALNVVDRTLDSLAELQAQIRAITQGAPVSAPADTPQAPVSRGAFPVPSPLHTASPHGPTLAQLHHPQRSPTPAPANRAQRRAAAHRHKRQHARTMRRGGRP